MRNRERIIAYNHDYYHNFLKKGLRKPKVKLSEEERKERRKAQQRARYWRDRERILAQQRIVCDQPPDQCVMSHVISAGSIM